MGRLRRPLPVCGHRLDREISGQRRHAVVRGGALLLAIGGCNHPGTVAEHPRTADRAARARDPCACLT